MGTQAFVLKLKAWVVKLVIYIALPALGVWAAKQVFNAVSHAKVVEFYNQPLTALVSVLPGETISVPHQSGIFVQPIKQKTVLMIAADKIGKSTLLNLCDQKTQSQQAANQIFPIYLFGKWSDLKVIQNPHPKSPVFLGEDADVGFPNAVITGVVQAFQNHQGDLKLNLLSQTEQAQIVYDQGQYFDKDVWLVWNQASDSDAKAYQSALHIKRSPLINCDAGQLEFELYYAKQTLASASKKTQVWVLGDHQPSKTVWLNAGEYPVPLEATKIEDQALFESAVASGLIQLSSHNTVQVAPQDLFTAFAMGQHPEGWTHVTANEYSQAILKRLYHKADGDYVRQQALAFNQKSQWGGFRLKSAQENVGTWSARVDGYYANIISGMPEVIVRLYDEPPKGWGQWKQVVMPTQLAESVTITLQPAKDIESLDIELLGHVQKVNGAIAHHESLDCAAETCTQIANTQKLNLTGIQAGKTLEITFTPNLAFAKMAKSAAEFNPIFVQDNQLKWRNAPKTQANMYQFAKVSMTDRNGVPLFKDELPTKEAKEVNLSQLVGLSGDHTHALAGILARLGEHGYAQVNAKLTLDTQMQQLAQSVVSCLGMNGVNLDTTTGKCSTQPIVEAKSKGQATYVKGRHAGLLVMDAGSGEVLAAAGDPFDSDQYLPQDIFAYDRFKPEASPLKVRNWQHAGSAEQAPGSTFKLVTALALEDYAKTHPSIAALLAGQNAQQITNHAKARGESFDLKSACYPSPCGSQGTKVPNYHNHTPMSYTQGGVFGLKQALSFSINTWFAWLAEQTDATLNVGKHHLPQAVAEHALDQQRPIIKMAHQLGFASAMHLDAGLMPESFKWQPTDVLQTTASEFEPLYDQHNVHRQAIGLTEQVTPLQMALVAASIGEGKFVQPHLIMQLNEAIAKPASFAEMQMPLTRIRAGMKDVVENGTARTVFSQTMQPLKKGLYAKTGTAPMKHLGGHMNTSWFVGYIEPNTIQGETRRLAFAAWVMRTPLTGGDHAAPMVASFMQLLNQMHSEKSS